MTDNYVKPVPPDYGIEDVKRLAGELYGFRDITVKPLASYIDLNFHIQDEQGREFVFKIANSLEKREILEAQLQVMKRIKENHSSITCQEIFPTLGGEEIAVVTHPAGASHLVHLLSFLPGTFMGDLVSLPGGLLENLGRVLGEVDNLLRDYYHPALHRYLRWDLQNLTDLEAHAVHIKSPAERRLVQYFLQQYKTFVVPLFPKLRRSVIYNDGNDYNVLTQPGKGGEGPVVTGLIDFGDIMHTYTIFELAVAIAYALHGQAEPLAAACRVTAGYHNVHPLENVEIEVLFPLICGRLCATLLVSAYQLSLDPGNEYLRISVEPARAVLAELIKINPAKAIEAFREACGLPPVPAVSPDAYPVSAGSGELEPEQLILSRREYLGKNLSTSYKQPLKIVRGAFQYLYDYMGRAYLDTVNNVCHVGHCHPRVVEAGQRQMAILNTNTRYLHDHIVEYARRLCATLPEPLRVCYFVNSGSEANELALRLARTHTKNRDFITIDQAYHGNTNAVIDISPYKFDGPGGDGAPPHVHKVMIPDVYRGLYKANDPDAGEKYARDVLRVTRELHSQNKKPAAFIHESIMSVAGQIVFPENYLRDAYEYVRAVGGVCIADEVQVGFARVGSYMWGFECQGVVPDIVTLGKPIGNGHPLGAVITTPAIAESFANGMEYFNTFGGNPVSCAVGLAVLDVIRDEKLQENALVVGNFMHTALKRLMERHSLIGDVRGMGLFLGIELVLNRETLEPATDRAYQIAERMKEQGILISIDGPLHNVIKIKPPLVFGEADADFYVKTLDMILNRT